MFEVKSLKTLAAAAGLALAFSVSGASAATFNPDMDNGDIIRYSGNGCNGGGPNQEEAPGLDQGGPGFGDCSLDGSPVIVKYENGDHELGNLFQFFNPDWITISFNDGADNEGNWRYDPVPLADGTVVGITGAYFKGGSGYTVWRADSPYYGGSGWHYWTTGSNNALSNATFFDTTQVIPLPAAGWLLLTALGGLGAAGLRRRRKENA
jgi:hypothetical protein